MKVWFQRNNAKLTEYIPWQKKEKRMRDRKCVLLFLLVISIDRFRRCCRRRRHHHHLIIDKINAMIVIGDVY